MITAAASDVQKNFGEWHDRSVREPVKITKYGRTSAYLVSASLFEDMWSSFRKAVSVGDLSDDLVALIQKTEVQTDAPYSLDDIPEVDASSAPGMK